ncbi:MAG: putative lipid II flippase FtsW, partial [Clostridia bacterium]|nr:putative lipid II flippase FtsW [Clostridia bacterium]
FGLLMIYSASSYSASIKYGNSYYFVIKQLIGFMLGIAFFMFCYNFDYHKYSKIKYWVLGISIVLLALIFVPGIGITSNGARRWIGVGGFTIQSSEIAKFGFVIFASCYMASNYKKMPTFRGTLPILIAGGVICMLILLEPNLSVTLCVGMVMLSMLFVGGMKIKHFLLLLIPALALVPILIIIEPYRLQRLTAFLNPWANPKEEGFQLIQSLYSLGSGGMFGVGLFSSRQKYLFLPFAESDFIFSIVGEELGFMGCVILCMVYLALILYGIKIAYRAQDRLGTYLAFGITSVITMQLLINICVVTGLIPPTGIPLPFISAGGTSLSVFMGAIGILLNVDRAKQLNFSFNFNVFKTKMKSRA